MLEPIKESLEGEFIKTLRRDGFYEDEAEGSSTVFLKLGPPRRRLAIHVHHKSDTMGPELLKTLLNNTGWDESDIKRLKLVK